MKTIRLIRAVIITFSLLFLQVSSVLAVPPLPSSFYGTVKVDGANVAAGTQVTAWVNGVQYSLTTIEFYEGDSVYSLDVSGDDSGTPGAIEGGTDGATVEFHIGSLVAEQTGTWTSGTNVQLNLTVTGNSAPEIEEGETTDVSMSEDGAPTAFILILHADDADDDTLTWSIAAPAGHGTATASGTGGIKLIGYTPAENYTGTDSFVVQVSDGNGGADTITVYVTINPVNDAPEIAQGTSTNQMISEDNSPTAFNLTLDAADVDSDTLTWSIATPAEHGTATASGTGTSMAIGYAPAANYNGTDQFVVRAADGSGGEDTITVYITISMVNDLPVIAEGDSIDVSMSEDGAPTAFSLTLNASDVDGNPLTWSIAEPAGHGTATASNTGNVKVIGYSPAADYAGADSFVVRVSDGRGGIDMITVNVTIEAVNDAPVIAEGASISVTMSEDSSPEAFELTLHAADVENDTLTWSIAAPAGHGTASASGSGETMSIDYTPDPGYYGTDSFVVQVADGSGGTDTITVNVNISKADNILPIITEGASIGVSMSEDGAPTPFNLTLNAADADGDTLTWSIATPAGHGTASASGTGAAISIFYTPDADFSGVDSFIVQVSDGNGGADTITVNVTVEPVNDTPVITEGESISVSMSEDGMPTPFNLTLNAADVEGDTLTWSIITAPVKGAASAEGGASAAVGYTPIANFYGADSFVVRVSDGKGGMDTITVNVTVTGVNDAPVITEGESVTVNLYEDGAPVEFALTLHASDVDGSSFTWSIAGAAGHGAAIASGTGASQAIQYTPEAGYYGPDSFVVQVADAKGATDTITVNVTNTFLVVEPLKLFIPLTRKAP